LKICDFGLARSIKEEMELSEYVVTRHYRAPEVMTNAKQYNERIDVWAVGCILAELLGRKILFPGTDYLDQLRLIIKVVGQPPREDLDLIQNHGARGYIEGLGPNKKAKWKDLFPTASDDACDLLDQMLQFNPKKRITVDEALKHDYLSSLYRNEEIIECKRPCTFDFNATQLLSEDFLRDIIRKEIYEAREMALGKNLEKRSFSQVEQDEEHAKQSA